MSEAGTCQQLLEEYAPQTGLSSKLEPFGCGLASTATLRVKLLKNPFLMAPMAGVSDAAYRMMARAGGAALAYSEMVSVAGLHFGGAKTWELVVPKDPEPDIAVQLFGSVPEQFSEATALVSERLGTKLALIDINMACPVPKVVRKGEGSALLDDPARAAAIVKACVAKAAVPVTVKIRSARRTGDHEVAPDFARTMEQAGAAAVAVHGRTASQLYRGEADWGVVSRVAAAVDIPVIGSGDVRTPADAARMLQKTGATAVMVARGSYGNPWIFGNAKRKLAGQDAVEPTLTQRLSAFACHVRLLEATGAHLARARSLSGWYLRGLPHATVWRERAMHCSSADEYLQMADALLAYARAKEA